MFCTKCGRKVAEDAAFCSGCGKPVALPTSEAARSTTSASVPSDSRRERNAPGGEVAEERLTPEWRAFCERWNTLTATERQREWTRLSADQQSAFNVLWMEYLAAGAPATRPGAGETTEGRREERSREVAEVAQHAAEERPLPASPIVRYGCGFLMVILLVVIGGSAYEWLRGTPDGTEHGVLPVSLSGFKARLAEHIVEGESKQSGDTTIGMFRSPSGYFECQYSAKGEQLLKVTCDHFPYDNAGKPTVKDVRSTNLLLNGLVVQAATNTWGDQAVLLWVGQASIDVKEQAEVSKTLNGGRVTVTSSDPWFGFPRISTNIVSVDGRPAGISSDF